MSSAFSITQLDLLFKNSNDAVFFMEKVKGQYRYIFVNDAAVKLINKNPCGKFMEETILAHLAKTIIRYYDLTIQEQKQYEYEDYTYGQMEVHKHRTTTIPVLIEDKIYILAITKEVSMSRDLEDKYLLMPYTFLPFVLNCIARIE